MGGLGVLDPLDRILRDQVILIAIIEKAALCPETQVICCV